MNIIAKKENLKPLGMFGNNQLIGYYDTYAIVFDFEKEQLYYFFMPEPIDSLLFSCVEAEILHPVSELPDEMQIAIERKFMGD